MQIEFVRSGGFAGIRLAGSFDTHQLLPDQASTLEKLIRDAGFFSLPEVIQPSSVTTDRFEYKITISSQEQTHSIRVSEAVIPESLRPLLAFLTTLVNASK